MVVATSQAQRTHIVSVHGTQIFTYESGQGSPIIYLHGSPDTHAMWLPLIEHISDDFHSIAIDLPGFGQSTMPDTFSLTLDNMADFVLELTHALNINQPVTLVTTDFGGHYGLAFTAKYPEKVHGIAISNTNFFSDYQWHFFAQLYRMPIIGELLIASATRGMMAQTLNNVAPNLPEEYIDASFDSGFGSKSVRKTILRMYRERKSDDFIGWEDRLLQTLKITPAIVLWGDQDPFITPEYAERFGNAEVHHFEEHSHWLPLEATEQYAHRLLNWLDTL